MARQDKHSFDLAKWPMQSDKINSNDLQLAEGFIQACLRMREVLNRRKASNFEANAASVGYKYFTLSQEICVLHVDYQKRLMLRDLFLMAKDKGVDYRSLLTAFYRLHMQVQFGSSASDQYGLSLLRCCGVMHTDIFGNAREIWIQNVRNSLIEVLSRKAQVITSQDQQQFLLVCEFALRQEDERLLTLLDPDIDELDWSDAFDLGLGSSLFESGKIEQQDTYLATVRKQWAQWERKYAHLKLTYENEIGYINEVYPEGAKEGADYFLVLLTQIARAEADFQLARALEHAEIGLVKGRLDRTIDGYLQQFMGFLCVSERFWYILLAQAVERCRRPDGALPLAEVARIFIEMVKHPKKIRKLNCSASAMPFKSLFQKHVAPLLIGVHPDIEEILSVDALTKDAPNITVHLMSSYVTRLMKLMNAPALMDGDAKARKALKEIWDSFITPCASTVLAQLVVSILSKQRADRSIDDLELEYLQAAEEFEAGVSPPVETDLAHILPGSEEIVEGEAALESDPSLPQPHRASVSSWAWRYVHNPSKPAETGELIELGTTALDVFFRKHRISCIVPVKSVLGALDYYVEASQSLRAQMPRVQISGHLWVKLKRGRQRILISMDENERIIFHTYPRREWKPEMFS